MIWMKQCPRCHGDLVEQRDTDGVTVSCLQCGRSLSAAHLQLLQANGVGTVARAARALPSAPITEAA